MAGSFFSWFQVVSVSFRWFQVVPCFSKCAFDNFNLGDFKARSKWKWWNSDFTTNEDTKINAVTSSYDLKQLISPSTHLLANSSFCIDLIFT